MTEGTLSATDVAEKPKLLDGSVILSERVINPHRKVVTIARECEDSTAGSFVRLEEIPRFTRCGRRTCADWRCAIAESSKLNALLTRVFRAMGDTVLTVTVPRLADGADFEWALHSVIEAGWDVMGAYEGVSIYGVTAVPEWHDEGIAATRAWEVVAAGNRAKFPYHQHPTVILTMGDGAPSLGDLEVAFTEAMRKHLDEAISGYKAALDWGDAREEIDAIKAKTLTDSVPVAMAKPLDELTDSEWYRLAYVLKNMDARTHRTNGGAGGAWGVVRQREICDALLVGAQDTRVTPLRGVDVQRYGWVNTYAYPDPETKKPRRFLSMGDTWTRKTLEDDTKARRKGGKYFDYVTRREEDYDRRAGVLETMSYKGVALSERITHEVIDADLTLTLSESIRRARSQTRARLLEECKAEYSRRVAREKALDAAVVAHMAQLREVKAYRRVRFTKALYAALSGFMAVLAQEGAFSLIEALNRLLAPVETKKAARSQVGVWVRSVDVQSLTQLPRPPPRKSAARLGS